MSDFVLILSLLYRWIFDNSAFVLGRASEKEKNKSVMLVSREDELFFENLIFNQFYESH